MKERKTRKKQGFNGQKLIIIPAKIRKEILSNDPITRQIYVTDIGYYPKAFQHYIDRPNGSDQHIIIYCVEGTGWVTIQKKKITVPPSSCMIIPAGTPHKYGVGENDPWTIYWVHFKGDIATFIVELITQNAENYLPRLSYHENRIRLFDEIYLSLENGYSIDNLRYASMLFHHFLSSLLYGEKYNSTKSVEPQDMAATTIEYMKMNLFKTLTLPELADQCQLSISHFCTIFRQKTGFAPIEYFNHLKIQYACQELAFSKKKIKQIAEELAFSDQYYFSRIFSQYMGTSPREYRKDSANKK
ncbi:AraC family transcriptional regulator [Chitinophaga sp.]|uniref:AraC family transcriptional regulator n=1 Tax=Chitinophaga sp. TaxID=1869181 RepID=UPI0031D69856